MQYGEREIRRTMYICVCACEGKEGEKGLKREVRCEKLCNNDTNVLDV